MKLAGARVLVTGGGSGIGRFLVERLDAESAEVCMLERDTARCAEINDLPGGRIKAYPCDVTDPAAVDAALQTVFDAGFDPDVLINNAGIIHSEPLVNMLSRGERVHSRETWRRVMSTDLDSVFFVTSRVVDHMLAKRCKGLVISISSISANGNPGQSAYSAAKAGVNALTLTWAKELGALGLRFAAIAPGFIDTPSTRAALSEAAVTRLQQQIPLRRLGDLQSVYLAVRHVIENDYLTGTVLEVDGGLVM
ncbi:MAG: SDR family NAD(P)-dependent oxidoreductase [Sulfuricella sp.]|nr:SDR family NAD(P)-dependent oxidoreductase [Sulfuricella sp.]